ncbi:MAG: hypothetical protein QOG63_864 [Thermoleophilaceae bacterium]|nr:hypothetical protein [Thermoleophilaceae bacterium]
MAARPRTRLTGRGRIVLALLAILLAAAAWFLNALFQPFHGGDGAAKVSVTIPRNSGVGKIADLLEQKGVVASAFFFEARATIGGRRSDLKPGTYTLRHDMSYSSALDALAKGPPANVVTIVVPEGKSRREIARSIKSLAGDYLAATKRSPLLDPAGYGAKGATDLEGFLFPATYQLKRGSDVKALVAKQLQAFKQRFAQVDLAAAKHVNLTPYDVLIIASLVEREASAPEERPLVASVIYNRLHDGTPLGIDATTRFQYDDWENPITQSQLQSPSPYNTRIHDGLPPGPIGNPGLASIEAAAHPKKTAYLYYVADCDNPGRHVFVRTQAEFDAASARYNAARDRAGGRAPTSC